MVQLYNWTVYASAAFNHMPVCGYVDDRKKEGEKESTQALKLQTGFTMLENNNTKGVMLQTQRLLGH